MQPGPSNFAPPPPPNPGAAPPFTSHAMQNAPTNVLPAPPTPAAVWASDQKPEMTLPPALWGSTKREPLRDGLRSARWMLIAYWVLLTSGYLALFAVVTAYEGIFKALEFSLMWMIPSLVGVAVGHVVGLLRVRPYLMWVGAGVLTIVGVLTLAVIPQLMIAFIAFVWSLACGHLAMQRKAALSAIWIPIICWAGAIIVLLEHERRLHVWQAGDKGSIWQPVPLLLLFIAVTEIFLFFAGQEHYHTNVWQQHTETEAALQRRAGGGARLTGRGIVALVVFSTIVCASVALLSPYLWRTEQREGHGSGGGDGQSQGQQGQGRDNGNGNGSSSGQSQNQQGQGRDSGNGQGNGQPQGQQGRDNGNGQGDTEIDPDAVGRALERAKREAERSAGYLLPLIPLFLLTRPLRRAFLLRHLRRPFWKLNPSRRARNLWRYVLIALGDAGIKRKLSDSIDEEVRRIDELRAQRGMPSPAGLADAAKQYQRMRFGLGIPPGAIDQLRGSVETAFTNVRAPLDEWQRVKSWWRRIDV